MCVCIAENVNINLLEFVEVVAMRPDLAETRSANFGAKDRRFNWLWLAGHGAPFKLSNSSSQSEQQDAVLETI